MTKTSDFARLTVKLNKSYVGYTTAEPIYDKSGKLLLASEKRLTEGIINALIHNKITTITLYA